MNDEVSAIMDWLNLRYKFTKIQLVLVVSISMLVAVDLNVSFAKIKFRTLYFYF